MKLLLIVDVQNDFCPGGALPVTGADAIVPLINGLREGYDEVVFTQDWHPADHHSFAANHPGRNVGDVVPLGGLSQVLWPVHCVQGTRGAEFHPELVVRQSDRIFRKGTDPRIDSYSAFFDNAHLKSTGLGDYLHSRGARALTLCGLATDYCVKFSALDALAEGFAVSVLSRACRGVNLKPDDSNRAMAELAAKGATILP